MSDTQKFFPILKGPRDLLPWPLIAKHEAQAQTNHYQSLRQLAGRGGLSWCEALAVLEDRRWRKVDDARTQVEALVDRWNGRPTLEDLAAKDLEIAEARRERDEARAELAQVPSRAVLLEMVERWEGYQAGYCAFNCAGDLRIALKAVA